MNRRYIVGLWLLVGWLAGCTTVPKISVTSLEQENILKDICLRFHVDWQWDSLAQVITLNFHDHRAALLVGSDVVLIDKEKIVLSAPIQLVNSVMMVPADFRNKVIDRLAYQSKPAIASVPTLLKIVVIDAGHGGKDPGAIGKTGVQEKQIN